MFFISKPILGVRPQVFKGRGPFVALGFLAGWLAPIFFDTKRIEKKRYVKNASLFTIYTILFLTILLKIPSKEIVYFSLK